MRTILLTAFFATAAFAQWERHVGTAKGDWMDTPSTHSLSFFTASECVGRVPEDRSHDPICDSYKTRTELKLIAHVGGFSVYDVNYFPFNPNQGAAKSILLESAPNKFHEIYFREQTQGDAVIQATRVLTVDGERILLARYDVGGMYRIFEEDYFSISKSGAKLMHPDRLSAAAAKEVPKGSGTYQPTSKFNFNDLSWEIWTEPSPVRVGPKVDCCTGRVTVHFKIENGDFVVTSARYGQTK